MCLLLLISTETLKASHILANSFTALLIRYVTSY
ncbi:hypothetical protein C5167_027807, partial [Papaver somniferum]